MAKSDEPHRLPGNSGSLFSFLPVNSRQVSALSHRLSLLRHQKESFKIDLRMFVVANDLLSVADNIHEMPITH